MVKVTIVKEKEKQQVQVKPGTTLLAALQKAGVQASMPCGGKQTCGKCKVKAEGHLSAMSESEQKTLKGQAEVYRLACHTTVLGECTIYLEENKPAQIETAYSPWEGKLDPIYQSGFGASFDIGTTTVAGQLFCAVQKEPLAVYGQINAQQAYGGDVLSRISYCNEHGVASLQTVIQKQLSEMLLTLCAKAGIKSKNLRQLTICGNTVMLYILCGIEVGPLALAPFPMKTHFSSTVQLQIPFFEDVPVYIPGCASAYVGADTTCSILTSKMVKAQKNVLLVDVGTNGEMALFTHNKLLCCSTAAGPAFEGAGIACGGQAGVGAINFVEFDGTALTYTTTKGSPADRICGSGLIDAVAAMLSMGALNEKGKISNCFAGKFFLGNSKVYISQQDIRALQLAKSAIRAGMDTLLHTSKISYQELDEIILCGGFGSWIRPESAQAIGLIPPKSAKKVKAIGNAAGNGAGQILQSKQQLEKAELIVSRMETVELASTAYFSKSYLSNIRFPSLATE